MQTRKVPVAEAIEEAHWINKVQGWVQLCSRCGWSEATEAVRRLPSFAEPDSGTIMELDYLPWKGGTHCEKHGVRYLGERCPVCSGPYVMSSSGGTFFVRDGEP
ncbi:hypothetical protein LXT21_11460 [Myxococcus sp. K38C18041901]|uniref:hypothetical protein n=1 Tax=Myxococcus guangdongensis TaxID=2906760 RepID=UPI0020A7F0AC|nr:hypothetical protein [Myxococcus guangdongensis]MCP3059392.1 hypothetical protein [Myxococcus guangdongensis]